MDQHSKDRIVVILFASMMMVAGGLFALLSPSNLMNNPSPVLKDNFISQTYNDKFDEFIATIKEDLDKMHPELIGRTINVSIGNYFFVIAAPASIRFVNLNSYLILVDRIFYDMLTREEREAVIAHELGHLAYPSPIPQRQMDLWMINQYQIKADSNCPKYVDIDACISMLEKVRIYNPLIDVRIAHLMKSKQD